MPKKKPPRGYRGGRNSKLTERNLGDGDAGTEASITAGLGFVALSFEASEHTILSAA